MDFIWWVKTSIYRGEKSRKQRKERRQGGFCIFVISSSGRGLLDNGVRGPPPELLPALKGQAPHEESSDHPLARSRRLSFLLRATNPNPSAPEQRDGRRARRRRLRARRAKPRQPLAPPRRPRPPRARNRREPPRIAVASAVSSSVSDELRQRFRPSPFISGPASSSHAPRVTRRPSETSPSPPSPSRTPYRRRRRSATAAPRRR